MFDIVNFTPAADVATSGTVTVGYPTGRTKGDYSLFNDGKHQLQVGQNIYNAPKDFRLTLNANASNITLTNVGAATIKAGTNCALSIERCGPPDKLTLDKLVLPDQVKLVNGNSYLINLGSPNALSTNGIAASQSVTISTSALALLNGTGTDVTVNADASVTLNTPRNVTAAWTGTAVLTVRGKDSQGNALTESSASGTSFTGKKAFKTVISATFSANVTSATIGYGDVLGLPVALFGAGAVNAEFFADKRVGAAAQKVRLPWVLNQVDLLAGSTNSPQLFAPFAGVISLIGTIVQKAVTTGGTITVQNGSTASVGGVVTIANSAAQQASQLVTPTAGDASQVVAKNDKLQIVPASFATAGEVAGFVEITPTDVLTSGTFVAADGTLATATTGDVRGTYKPELATDGTSSIALLVTLFNPTQVGVAQYAG